ncbi:MAG TPA: EAL domain-containing protein [Thermoanaerobaculia bacterium]
MPTTRETRRFTEAGWPVWALAALVVYFLGYAARVVQQGLRAPDLEAPTAVHIPPLGLVVVALAFWASRLPHLDARLRTAWRRFAAAYALLAGGTLWQLACAGFGWPGAGLSHLLWFAYYPLLLAGFVAASAPMGGEGERRRYWLDVAVVATGGGMVLALLFAARLGELVGTLDLLLPIGYLAGDVGLLAGFAIVFLRVRGDRLHGWLAWLGAALLVEIAGDAAYGFERLAEAPGVASLANVLYAGAWVLRGVAAVRVAGAAAAVAEPARAASAPAHPLPYVAIVLGYAALGVAIWLDLGRVAAPLVAAAGLLTLLVLARQASSASEIAELRAASAVRAGEERFRSLVQNSSDLLMVVSADGEIREATPSVERILGFTPDELAGSRLESLMVGDQVGKLRHFLTQVVLTPGSHALIELVLRHRDGTPVEAEPVAVNLLADPAVDGIVLTLRDIRERRGLEKRLSHMAFHDALTGLANRLFFAEQLAHARSRARRHRAKVAVLYVDLDEFKQVNDELGHTAGDQVLVEIARRIAVSRGGTDTAARLGGDEFAVLLEDVADLDEACAEAERLRATMAAPLTVHGRELAVGASVGVAEMSPEEDDEDLLRHADLAMYHAKEEGKGRVMRFDASLRRESPRRRRENELRRAIDAREFELHFQPVCRIADGRVVGAEALLRWRRSEDAFSSPAEFLDLAEESGLIHSLGDWVVDESCRFAADWARRGGRPASVGFNVSAAQIAEARFTEVVAEALQRHRCSPRSLVVEITESTAAGSHQELLANLLRLRELGVRVAIDDFGAGYSSLQRLQELPVEILKVDRSLVAALGTGAPPAVMRATVELARSLGLELVAEGVETAAHRDHLRTLGCVWGQGFFWGAGVPPETFLARWAPADGSPVPA